MSNDYQIQSQWENESAHITNNGQDSSERRRGITIHKKTILIVLTVLVITLVSAFVYYSSARSIEGIWVRQMDDNTTVAGMTVQIIREDGKTQGKIISMPENAQFFEVGLIKWFGIRRTGFGQYEFYDLTNPYDDINDRSTYRYSYNDSISNAIISSDGKTMTINSPGDGLGKYQLWIKTE